jgi:predicted metal-dependent phosphoesterase TrpH
VPAGAKTLKIELHVHTSRYSPCARAAPQEVMARLIETGYDAVYLTEHDAVWGAQELAELQGRFPAIRIFPGVEVGTMPLTGQRLQHLLVLGTHDATYIDLAERPAEIIARARAEGCLAILAHPFRWPEAAQMLTEGIVPDALEAYTVNHGEAGARQALAAAEKLGIPAVNAGDVHALDFIDRYWIETDEPLVEAKDIRRIVTAGLYRNVAKGR